MSILHTSAWTESLKAEGKAEGKAGMLIRVLERDGVEITDQARQRILDCTDPNQVETWVDKAFDHPITHADQLFEK